MAALLAASLPLALADQCLPGAFVRLSEHCLHSRVIAFCCLLHQIRDGDIRDAHPPTDLADVLPEIYRVLLERLARPSRHTRSQL